MSFPEQIHDLRSNLGVSQADLAQKMGVSQATISAWEKGHKTPPYPDRILTQMRQLTAGQFDGSEAPAFALGLSSAPNTRRARRDTDAFLPQKGQEIFDQVRDYMKQESLESEGVLRGLDVWLLGPATLPITQLDEQQSIGSLNLTVELITTHRAHYHMLWDLERMGILSPELPGQSDISPEITTKQMHDTLLRIEQELKGHTDSPIAKMHHLPIIRPQTRKGGTERVEGAKSYWNKLKSSIESSDLKWKSHSICAFPDMTSLNEEDELNILQLMSIWSDGSSVILYQPKVDTVGGLEDFGPHPIANMRSVEIWNHWDRSKGERFSPFSWLSDKRAKKICELCAAWENICERSS